MTRQHNINNSIVTEDNTLSNDILIERLKELTNKIDTVLSTISEMQTNSALKNKDYEGKFDHFDLRIKVLEDERATNAKKPIKYEIIEKIITGSLYGFGGLLSLAGGIFIFKAMGVPVSTILKTLFMSLGA